MKKFKKYFKKFLKWTGISLLVILILLIIIPIIFKDEIKEMVIQEVNKSLTADLSLEDFDLTFISTFPNMTINLYDAKLTGRDEFNGVELANIEKVRAHVGLWDVVSGDQIEVDAIYIENPKFDVRVLENGLANYDIVKPDSIMTEEELSEPSSFKLSLQEYEIKNATVKYDDRASDMLAILSNLEHSGSGDLTAEVIDFKTETTIDELSFNMDGMDYFSKVKTDADVNLLMELKESSSKFTLKENKIKLNAIEFAINGFYEMLSDHDDMDLSLDASKASFKDFLSLIPTFYHSGYESMVSTGDLSLKGLVKGKMDAENMPGWDFGMKLTNGSVKYQGLPGKISNIQIDGGSKFSGGTDLDKMTIEVPKFHANLSKNTIDANLFVRPLKTNPYLRSVIKANFDLATIKNFIPVEEGESYSGILDADVDIDGDMRSLDEGNFEEFKAKGILELSKLNYKSSTLSENVIVDHMKFTFSPDNLELNEMKAKMGESDFKMKGKVDNYFGYMLRDEVLKGNFSFNSKYLNLDELMGVYPDGEAGPEAEKTAESSTSTSEEEPTLVPSNIDFLLNSKIDRVRYNGIEIKKLSGDVTLKDEVASLNNMKMKAMGGSIGMNGNYDTRDHSTPKFDFGYSLNDIDIEELTKNFITVGKLAPIAKFAKGKISSNFDMSSDLTKGLMPVLNSISSDGDVSSNSLSISGFKLLEKMESQTKIKNISKQTINNFKTHFSVHQGKVMLTPFDVKLGNIDTEVSGYTTLEKDMHYKFAMDLPKEKIPASVLNEVEGALKQANALVPNINLGELPSHIPINIIASGDVKNPKITSDIKESLIKATGNKVDAIKETVKDSVTSIVNEQVDNIKEEVEKQKKAIMKEAQKKADQVKVEAKKAADKVRVEADKHAEQLLKEAGGNPIKKKIAQEAGKKYKAEAEKKAQKIEDEGEKKADNIMKKAQDQADKLG